MMKQTLVPILLLLTAVTLAAVSRPRYIECSNSLECGLEYCCVLGSGRYSLPRCEPLRKANDKCRPGQTPLNISVSYPDGQEVEFDHIYSILCPCQEGLQCSEITGNCEDPSEDLFQNTI